MCPRRGCAPSASVPAATRSARSPADSCSRSPRSRRWWPVCGASCATTATTGRWRSFSRSRWRPRWRASPLMWPSLAMRLKTTEPVVWQVVLATLGSLLAAGFGALAIALAAGVGSWAARVHPHVPLSGPLPPWAAGAAAALFVAGAGALGGGAATAETPLWPSLEFESAALPLARRRARRIDHRRVDRDRTLSPLYPRSRHRGMDAARVARRRRRHRADRGTRRRAWRRCRRGAGRGDRVGARRRRASSISCCASIRGRCRATSWRLRCSTPRKTPRSPGRRRRGPHSRCRQR